MRHIFLKSLLIAAALLGVNSSHAAQLTADQTIRVILYTPAGGPADVVLRLMGEKVTAAGGPKLLIEAKTGGAGAVAAAAVKTAPADGRTLLLGDMAMFSINPTMIPNLSYAPGDFKSVTLIYSFATVLGVPATSPAKNVKELIALAKSTPGGLSYGTQAPGSLGHLLGALLFQTAGVKDSVVVHYRGATPAATDLAAGQVNLVFGSYPGLLPFVEKNQVRMLAVASKNRLSAAPDLPTMGEAGYPAVAMDYWFALFAPAGTPDAIITELNEHFVAAAKTPDIVQRMNAMALDAAYSTPGELDALIKTDAAKLAPLVRSLDLKLN
jgi:tripartite-type tricarboxylate transporter receptor subunit TctC